MNDLKQNYWKLLIVFAIGFVAFFSLAVGSVFLARISHNVAVFWPANAALVSIALAFERRNFPILLVAAFTANAITQMIFGDPWQTMLGFPLANGIEIVIAYFGMRSLGFERNPVSNVRQVMLLLAVVALAGVPAAAVGSITVSSAFGGSPVSSFAPWWAGVVVSSMVVYLPVLSYRMFSARGGPAQVMQKRTLIALAIVIVISVLGSLVLLALRLPPAVVVLFPTLWIALKGRAFGVAVVGTVLSLITSAVVALGYVPDITQALPLREAVFQQQALSLFCTFPTFLTAIAIANLEESQTALTVKHEALAITLSNMNQGVSVFDSHGKLTVWNEKYLQAFGMENLDVVRGASFLDLLKYQQDNGDFKGEPSALLAAILHRVSKGLEYQAETILDSGRFIRSVHSPTPVGGWIGTHEDITEKRALEDRLSHESLHDSLTGVANRRYFEKELQERLDIARSNEEPIALLTIDLDHFKKINDTYGHDIGDEILKWAISNILEVARDNDFLARVGGDEFMLITTRINSAEDAAIIAAQINSSLSLPVGVSGNICMCNASIGAAYSPDGQVTRRELLRQSDIALYAAKEAGRSTSKVYNIVENEYFDVGSSG